MSDYHEDRTRRAALPLRGEEVAKSKCVVSHCDEESIGGGIYCGTHQPAVRPKDIPISEEERKLRAARKKELDKKRRDSRTPEQRLEDSARKKELDKKRRDSRTPEQRLEDNARMKERRDSRTLEQRLEDNARMKERRDSRTPEKRLEDLARARDLNKEKVDRIYRRDFGTL